MVKFGSLNLGCVVKFGSPKKCGSHGKVWEPELSLVAGNCLIDERDAIDGECPQQFCPGFAPTPLPLGWLRTFSLESVSLESVSGANRVTYHATFRVAETFIVHWVTPLHNAPEVAALWIEGLGFRVEGFPTTLLAEVAARSFLR